MCCPWLQEAPDAANIVRGLDVEPHLQGHLPHDGRVTLLVDGDRTQNVIA